MKAREDMAKKQQADFLAPYVCRFKNQDPSAEEAKFAFESCLNDLKKYFLELINGLEKRYDEV
jgi:hypothetical protein